MITRIDLILIHFFKKKFIRVEKNFDSFLQKRKIHKHKVSFTPKIKKVQNKISDSFNINDFWNYL